MRSHLPAGASPPLYTSEIVKNTFVPVIKVNIRVRIRGSWQANLSSHTHSVSVVSALSGERRPLFSASRIRVLRVSVVGGESRRTVSSISDTRTHSLSRRRRLQSTVQTETQWMLCVCAKSFKRHGLRWGAWRVLQIRRS